MKGIFVLFLLLILLVLVSSKNSYIVTVPKQIRAGSFANVCVNILRRGRGRTTVTATLMTFENQTLSRRTRTVFGGRVRVLKLKVPRTAKPTYNYKIQVSASGFVSFRKTARNVRVTSKASSIFIQLSRPLYKPGDLVQFRAVGTFPNLKVVNDPFDVIIYDPKRNRIKQFLGVRPAYGVFRGSLQLSPLTTFGNWRIQVKQLRETVSKSFEVKEFVLPKFDVSVIVPTFQLTTDEYFTFTISAVYTFGKPVKGTAKITLGYRFSRNNRKITKEFPIFGKAVIRILMREVQPRLGNYIPIFVEVTEAITGNKANSSRVQARIYTYPEKMEFSQNQPRVFKPGIPYVFILRVTKRDDTPLPFPAGNVNFTVYYDVYKTVSPKKKIENQYQEERRFQPRCPPLPPTEQKLLFTRAVPIPKDGVIKLRASFPKNAVRGRIIARFAKTSASWYVERAGSASNNFIQIRIPDGAKAEPGKPLRVTLEGTEKVPFCLYKIFSKGSLFTQGRFNQCISPNGASSQTIRISADMAPKATLLVYYVRRRSGEVVAASVTFVIEDVFKNKVDIKFDVAGKPVLPNQKVDLKITADRNSLVSILAVDKSILLLKTGHDITVVDVLNELQRYSSSFHIPFFRRWDWWRPRILGAKDAFAVFQRAGVYVLTDADLYQYTEEPQQTRFKSAPRMLALAGGGQIGPIGARGPEGASQAQADPGSSGLAQPTRVRTFFPETWIWADARTGANGKATFSAKAPDTITEWVASAFAVNPRSGLGVAPQMANVTTFQRFFARLELPPVAIRGEILLLQASIFNFMDRDLQVSVKLAKSDGYDFLDNDENVLNPGGDGWVKKITVTEEGVAAAVFPIRLKKVGDIKIKVTAQSSIIADALERILKVKAEGIQESYTIPTLIDLRNGGDLQTDITIDFPAGTVPDSEFIKVKVIGDLMGATLENLENLVQQSYGCGEQNMLRFAPNAFVADYLKKTNRLTKDLDAKLKSFLEKGYQIQLTYMRNDGSFSAFGNRDKKGSTWLTAFVAKSFAQASKFTDIDPNVMDRTITYLLNRQLPSGEIQELGIVRHKAMQGGSTSSKKSLTAYVVIALLECRNNNQIPSKIRDKANKAIDLSIKYISAGAPGSLRNLYELIIVGYALRLANDGSASAILAVMEQKAVFQGNGKYWTIPPIESQIIKPYRRWAPPGRNSRALDIEITSYALLIYNINGDTLNGFSVLQWLEKQRNGYGGFISTQDTVVALQALAGLAEKLFTDNFNMEVFVGTNNGWQGKLFDINNANSLVLQRVDVPNDVRELYINADGTGLCVAWVQVFYNVKVELREPAFNLIVTVLKDSINGFTLRICFRWLRKGSSTMGYLEVNEPTGMQADMSSLKSSEARGLYKKIERGFRKVNLYFDEITSTEMCVEIDMTRIALVARHKPVSVELSEYYEPSNYAKQLYQSQKLKDATLIEVCGMECRIVKK